MVSITKEGENFAHECCGHYHETSAKTSKESIDNLFIHICMTNQTTTKQQHNNKTKKKKKKKKGKLAALSTTMKKNASNHNNPVDLSRPQEKGAKKKGCM